MNPFDIFITHISWGTGGKDRPVPVAQQNNNKISVYTITTKYGKKSKKIQEQY